MTRGAKPREFQSFCPGGVMKIETRTTSLGRLKDEAVVLLVGKDASAKRALKKLDDAHGAAWSTLVSRKTFTGASGQVSVLTAAHDADVPTVVVAGVGDGDSADLREAAGRGVRAARSAGARSVSLLGAPLVQGKPIPARRALPPTVEGVVIGLYRFQKWHGEASKQVIEQVSLLVEREEAKRAAKLIHDGRSVGEGVCIARDLGNEPSNEATPSFLAARAESMASELETLSCEALDEPRMRELGMGALLGVSQGSAEPGRLILLTHTPKRKTKVPTIAFVGKGVTFDTGGISIKPGANMEDMKFDMCGGAAVIGAMHAVASLNLPVRVVGLVPAAENMPGSRAYKPGDILRAMNGKTIEIRNTDAEGRLLLADALTYAARMRPKPKAVVDLATLTGAAVRTFGPSFAGLVSSNDRLADRVLDAAKAADEPLWRMPLIDAYRERLKSPYADLTNLAGGVGAGLMTAAAFLENFTEGLPWAHLDIAPTAWTKSKDGLSTVGATGYGVRALVALARNW